MRLRTATVWLGSRAYLVQIPNDNGETIALCNTACVNPSAIASDPKLGLRNFTLCYDVAKRVLVGVTEDEVMSLTLPDVMKVLQTLTELASTQRNNDKDN